MGQERSLMRSLCRRSVIIALLVAYTVCELIVSKYIEYKLMLLFVFLCYCVLVAVCWLLCLCVLGGSKGVGRGKDSAVITEVVPNAFQKSVSW